MTEPTQLPKRPLTPTPLPTDPEPPDFPLQVFDDVARVFKTGSIHLSDVSDISSEVTEHYGFKTALLCVRVQLGPGKWAYVSAAMATPLRQAHRRWIEQHCDPAL